MFAHSQHLLLLFAVTGLTIKMNIPCFWHIHPCLLPLFALWCDGSDDDDLVPSNPDLLTQIDETLQPCLSCHLDNRCT